MAAIEASRSGTGTILVVEDSAALRTLITRILKPAGYLVVAAASGDEALQIMEQQNGPVDLLLTDVVLPGIGGRELAERLSEARPGMKVLYMSGYTGDAMGRHAGLDDTVAFLGKPFTSAVLLQKVHDVLDS
jgi:CheY-like chemotaxis protein